MRTVARLAALAAASALLAGCGQQAANPPEAKAGSGASSAPEGAERPWLLRLDSYSGEDGETKQATYLTITPATGDVVEVTTPRLKVAEASGAERLLLVDADHSTVLPDIRPSRADRDAGRVTLYDLAQQGKTSTLDVRRATGDRSLTTDWVAFDPTTPGRLRVVDGLTVWLV